jgi:plasmid maintenance system antidote protein VapI
MYFGWKGGKMNLTVGERLKDLLEKRGVKIKDIVNNGDLCHKTAYDTIKDENDKITPKVALILSQCLDVSVDYILGNDTFTVESLDRLKQLSKEDLKILNDLIVSDDLVAFLKGYNAYKENLTK